jgi:hypothetical protein
MKPRQRRARFNLDQDRDNPSLFRVLSRVRSIAAGAVIECSLPESLARADPRFAAPACGSQSPTAIVETRFPAEEIAMGHWLGHDAEAYGLGSGRAGRSALGCEVFRNRCKSTRSVAAIGAGFHEFRPEIPC